VSRTIIQNVWTKTDTAEVSTVNIPVVTIGDAVHLPVGMSASEDASLSVVHAAVTSLTDLMVFGPIGRSES